MLCIGGTRSPALLLVAAFAGPALAQQSATPTFVQGAAFSAASPVTVTLTSPVAQGDLLVGWFAQYHAPGETQVSDNVNGTWTRALQSLTFLDDTGDIALYYRENSQAAPNGITITVSVPSSAFLQGSVADYSGVALAGSLDQIVAARVPDGTAVDTGETAAVGAGELVFAALVASPAPSSVTPGSSQGIPYTPRAQTERVAAYEEDITSSAAGGQHGTATLSSATDWYAVCAVFHPLPATPPERPSTPTGLEATSVASTRVALSWSPSTGSVAGYAVYRNGTPVGTARPDTTTFMDADVAPSTTYEYSVDAFDLANDHSAQSAPLTVTTPAASPEFVQGVAASSANRISSDTLTLTEPVSAGDLLVGWFSQFNAPGEVQVSDDVNGPWTRSVSTTFSGTGDIALFYRERSLAAPSGLAITVSASAPAYLQEAVADYRHVATAGALDQAVVSEGDGTHASVGPTASVPAGGRHHGRPAGLRDSRKQPDGAVRPRRPERKRLLRRRGHPVQRRRAAAGEPDPRHGHQLVHVACHLPFHFHDVHDGASDDDDHHHHHAAFDDNIHHVHQHHHHATFDDNVHHHHEQHDHADAAAAVDDHADTAGDHAADGHAAADAADDHPAAAAPPLTRTKLGSSKGTTSRSRATTFG